MDYNKTLEEDPAYEHWLDQLEGLSENPKPEDLSPTFYEQTYNLRKGVLWELI